VGPPHPVGSSGIYLRDWFYISTSADGKKIAAYGSGEIFVSMDSGLTWALRKMVLDFSGVAFSKDGSLLAATTGRNVYTSTDDGDTWSKTAAPAQRYSGIVSSADGSTLAAITGPGFNVIWIGYRRKSSNIEHYHTFIKYYFPSLL
jgi:photosystem II stability/assembly factor-like uncharacterized protein